MGGDKSLCRWRKTFLMFQSTPPHGGRHDRWGKEYWLKEFQSTPPHGGRLLASRARIFFWVSIHAPAWGATCLAVIRIVNGGFNPRPRMGGDCQAYPKRQPYDRFQSTPPHGGRLHRVRRQLDTMSFNPRPRMGGDF